jgi:YfiH family protein
MDQIHSSEIVFADSNISYKCDGIYTNKIKLPLVVKTADCVPLLMESSKGVSATHAGWRGLEKSIFEKSLDIHEISSLKISIGPHARKCCYEVGVEFLKTFNNSINKVNDKYYLDLTKNIKQFAFENNINLEDTNVCTICNKEYFSYRKNKTNERQFSFIWI